MICYTSIFGPYDDLKEPLVVTEGWQYICFTDQPLTSKVWQIEKRELIGDARMTSKHYKILFHEHIKERYSMWVDASFIINCDLSEFWKRFIPPFTLLQHPSRNCVYKEGDACMRNRRCDPSLIQSQIDRYRREGLPKNNGMAASGIMMRERTEETIEFSKLWYDELKNGCTRDQISYAYADWKLPITSLTDWNYTKETEFLFIPHLNSPERRAAKLSFYKKQGLL